MNSPTTYTSLHCYNCAARLVAPAIGEDEMYLVQCPGGLVQSIHMIAAMHRVTQATRSLTVGFEAA